MKHGYSTSTIAVVALIGVAVFLAWTSYQSTAGVNYSKRITDSQSSVRSNMEAIKGISGPALMHASNDAALSVAESGGGMGTERIWFCDGVRAPPTFHELLYSLSDETLGNLNSYLDDSTAVFKDLGIKVEPYSCAGTYPEVVYMCPQTDYPKSCDGWNLTSTGGSLFSNEDGTVHKYVGDIISEVEYNRFFWMYYRLLEAEMEDSILAEVKDVHAIETNCNPETDCIDPADPDCCCITVGNLTAIFDRIVANSKFFGHFDKYVTCSVEKECIDTYSMAVKITCIDRKYKISGDDETGKKYLTWVIKEMITVGCEYEECVIIGGGGGGGTQGQPPATMAGYKDKNTKGDLNFASGTHCNNHMKCFDIDRCAPPFEKELCFSP
ncbi:MAG: hypothetical protein U9Q92_04525 [archaeon]|nr:hypothetical protein [archaeon]